MDQALKSVWGASEINIDSDYKLGSTEIVAFGKTAQRMIK